MARSDRSHLGSCNPESIEQRQIDDSRCQTSVILKVINLALFLGDEAKFHAEKLHADARCHDPYLPIAKLQAYSGTRSSTRTSTRTAVVLLYTYTRSTAVAYLLQLYYMQIQLYRTSSSCMYQDTGIHTTTAVDLVDLQQIYSCSTIYSTVASRILCSRHSTDRYGLKYQLVISYCMIVFEYWMYQLGLVPYYHNSTCFTYRTIFLIHA